MKMNPKIEVRDSPIEGKGLFAISEIKKDEKFWVAEGVEPVEEIIMNDEEFKAFMEKCTEEGNEWDAISLGNGMHSAAIADRDKDPSNYGNHSCEPNSAPFEGILIALRDINPGEEITADYRLFSSKDWEMECQCGSAKCKGIVKGTL